MELATIAKINLLCRRYAINQRCWPDLQSRPTKYSYKMGYVFRQFFTRQRPI
jgi:hypothetical protein